MLSLRMTPLLTSAPFLLAAKLSSQRFSGVFAWLKICRTDDNRLWSRVICFVVWPSWKLWTHPPPPQTSNSLAHKGGGGPTPLKSSSHLIVHAIEQTRHNRENGGSQGLHVIGKETDVPLVEPDPSSMAVHHRLRGQSTRRNYLRTQSHRF